ncbi:hypothetical protein, partial [Dokdonella sp.]|uniref:hypothetical protein n=1 Tax=Dokdonella sp. TaxID=2291710 RepID=UPI002CF466E5
LRADPAGEAATCFGDGLRNDLLYVVDGQERIRIRTGTRTTGIPVACRRAGICPDIAARVAAAAACKKHAGAHKQRAESDDPHQPSRCQR